MSKNLLWLVILCLVGVLIWTWLTPTKEPQPDYNELVNHIDSLNSEISLLKLQRDSLHNVIDSSKVKVDVIEHWYEKELTDITNQSIADDVVFFTEYLSEVGNDSLVVITPQQLKATNLIFLEHKKFKLEIPELKKQITSYESLINSYERNDSVKNAQINRLMLHAQASEQVMQNQLREINKLESKKKLYKGLTVGGVTVSVVLLITLLLK